MNWLSKVNAKKATLSVSLLSLCLATACTQKGFQSLDALEKVNNGELPSKLTRPQCELPTVDYILDTEVLGFEVIKSRDVSFGFNLLKFFIRSFEGSFKVQNSQLTIRTNVRETLKPKDPLAPALGFGELQMRERNFQIGFFVFSGGYSSFSQTPLVSVFQRAVDQAVGSMAGQLASVEPEWSSTIVSLPTPTELVIPAGSNAGLRVGDEFEVFNIEHIWEGKPCDSKYLLPRATTSEPIAVVKIESGRSLYPNASLLKILSQNSRDAVVEQGARVYLRAKGGEPLRSLRRSANIKSMKPFVISYETSNGTQVIDLNSYLKEILMPTIYQKGMYLKDVQDSEPVPDTQEGPSIL